MKGKTKLGFSLLELILVLGIGTMVAFVKFQDMKNEQESIIAKGAGQQLKQIGEAVNKYISIRYDKLATLTNSAGTGTDPGPRTCNTLGCDITYQTLINEGLLPSTYTGINIIRSSYKIFLKRGGTSPNYIINGLVTTTNSWMENGSVRYDLLGKSLQEAGIDSGVSKTAANVSGYNGQWNETATNFPIITTAGQLAYRVGYDAALYSVYLRRDGTLPMTGDLNMGGNNITNAKDITASGNGSFGGRLTANGIDPNDLPTGWAGGMRATDMLANATIAVVPYGKTGASVASTSDMAAYMDRFGNVFGANTVTSGGQVIAHNGYGDTMSLGGDAGGNDYEIRLGTGTKFLSIYSPNAADYSTVLNVYKNTVVQQRLATNGLDPNDIPPGFSSGGLRTVDVVATGSLYSIQSGTAASEGKYAFYARQDGNVKASGNIQADNFQPTSTAGIGNVCSYSGAISRDASGFTLSCQSGKWQRQYVPAIIMRDDGVWAANSDFQACNSDEVVVGGGGQCEDPAHHYIHYSAPSNNGWSVDCYYTDPQFKDLGSRTYALCMKK